jgi:hypothetical protein
MFDHSHRNRKSPQGKTLSSPEFQCLIATFQRIVAISDPIERDFELGRTAKDHGLPRQEIRKLYREWAIAQLGGGAA